VSLNCTLTSLSLHIIDAAALGSMKPTAYLVNTARGPLVDNAALSDALASGVIAGAALDVFEDEPLPAESALRELHNCMLAPHNSNSSPEAWERVHENTVRNLLEELYRPREPLSGRPVAVSGPDTQGMARDHRRAPAQQL
jgi:D-3-phosphoglycerate dehydrogenase